MNRYIKFSLAVAVGIGLGFAYGWLVSPVEFTDTSPDTLRLDYQTDYVLMVAEAYAVEKDPLQAARRLAILGGVNPLASVNLAVESGGQLGYPAADIALMERLADDLLTWNPALQPFSP